MNTLAEEVVEQLKTDMDNVYDAGYQKGKSEGGGGEGLDVSKFGIINEVTGTNIATCDYVNENPHNVEVKLSSDTVTDFSGVEVKCFSGNLFDISTITAFEVDGNTIIKSPTKEDYVLPEGKALPNTQYYISYEVDVLSESRIENFNFLITYTDGSVLDKYIHTDTPYIVTDVSKSVKHIKLRTLGATTEQRLSNVMISVGSIPSYQPYTETTYTANADGTLSIPSVSPTMNIICDTEGVDVSAKYYCMQDVEWNRFWDNYQEFGTRVNYNSAFRGYAWTDKIFKPKYKAEIQHCTSMFEESTITEITENETDFSKATAHYSTFQNCKKLKKLMFSVKSSTILSNTMYAASELETLYIFDYQANCKETNAFALLYGLKNVVITGTIGISVKFQWSNLLEVESAKNILRCLANLIDTNPFTQSITFHGDVWAKLAEEGNASPNGNTWEEYLTDIGWTKL